MEIILVQPVRNLGTLGQIVKVKDGYGRNYLIPKGMAIRATESNKKLFEDKKAEIERKNTESKTVAVKVSEKLDGQVFTVIKQAGDDGRLFGSVSSKELAKIISSKAPGITHSNIVLKEPIKALGLHEVSVSLHSEVRTKVTINVARSESEAQDALRLHNAANQEKVA